MRLAIGQANAVKGTTYPNPPVGAVILDRDGEVAGVGGTQPAGEAHAEVMALRRAGTRAAGGTAVVTLEPCNHQGRTGPCVDALLDAGLTPERPTGVIYHPLADRWQISNDTDVNYMVVAEKAA